MKKTESIIEKTKALGYELLDKSTNKLGEYSLIFKKGKQYLVKVKSVDIVIDGDIVKRGFTCQDEGENEELSFRIFNSHAAYIQGF